MNISKYFWSLNKRALEETARILKNSGHPQFKDRLKTLLSRCDNPKELFSLIPRKEFIKIWPAVNSYWRRLEKRSDFREWWQAIYEQIIEEQGIKQKKLMGDASGFFINIGKMIREARVRNNLSQIALARKTGLKQPDISKIEEGKKNITLATLSCLCKILGIKEIKI